MKRLAALPGKKALSPGEEAYAQQLRTTNLPTVEREHEFWLPRKWRFDFAWPAHLIAVEIEGGIWVKGAHNRGKHFESDIEKYNAAAMGDWCVLRFSTEMVEDGRALRETQFLFRARGIRP